MAARAAITKTLTALALAVCLGGQAWAQDAGALWAERTQKGLDAARAGKSNEALAFFNAALKAAQTLGHDDPRLATAKSNLALQRLKSGTAHNTGQLLNEALELRRRVLGDLHERTGDAWAALATYHTAQDDIQPAEVALAKALVIYEKLSGPTSPKSVAALDRLMQLAIQGQRYNEAIRLARRLLAADGESPPADRARRRQILAAMHAQADRPAQAHDLLRNARSIKDSPELRIDLAFVLAAQDKSGQALEVLQDTAGEQLAKISILMQTSPADAQALWEDIAESWLDSSAVQDDDALYEEFMQLPAMLALRQGHTGEALKRITARVEALEQDAQTQPAQLAAALIKLARIQSANEDHAAALTAAERAISIEQTIQNGIPQLIPMLKTKAQLQAAAGLEEDARQSEAMIKALYR